MNPYPVGDRDETTLEALGTLAVEDCLSFLRRLPDNSIDSLVTDPPAGISFMGKSWDSNKGGRREWIAWMAEVMTECLRVTKPGGHALVWSLPRTSHWTATALEEAGWEIRDCVTHLFGSGFPKSLDVGKALDKAAGERRKVVGRTQGSGMTRQNKIQGCNPRNVTEWDTYDAAPISALAQRYDGWGTALKPAAEFWWLARKPLAEPSVARNVARWGTGALNIDGCRNDAPVPAYSEPALNSPTGLVYGFQTGAGRNGKMSEPQTGRWPANLVLDEEVAEVLDKQSSVCASQFFYVAKASRRERNTGVWEQAAKADAPTQNNHPTVKSLALMRWLCRMVTPPQGVVLDPFAGSGSTLMAAQMEGFRWIGCENNLEYVEIAKARLRSIE